MTRIVFGPHAVTEAIRSSRIEVFKIWMEQKDERRFASIFKLCTNQNVKISIKSKHELNQVSGDVRHQGILAFTSEYPFENFKDIHNEIQKTSFFVAFDEIVDPQNLGAMIRSAVAFGAKGVILHRRRSAEITPVVVRASCGATEHAKVYLVPNLSRALQDLKKNHVQVIGLDMDGETEIDSLTPHCIPAVMVVGSEGKGLRSLTRKNCDIMCKISMSGPMESLNASVAAGIAFAHMQKLCNAASS